MNVFVAAAVADVVVARAKRKQSHLYVEKNLSTQHTSLIAIAFKLGDGKKATGREIQSKNGFEIGTRGEIKTVRVRVSWVHRAKGEKKKYKV